MHVLREQIAELRTLIVGDERAGICSPEIEDEPGEENEDQPEAHDAERRLAGRRRPPPPAQPPYRAVASCSSIP